MQDKIDIQRKKIQAGNPTISLSDSCRIDNGIDQFSEVERDELFKLYESRNEALDLCFFIPASGSGSRMFSALYDFLNNPSNEEGQNAVAELVQHIERFAFYHYLSDEWKEKLRSGNYEREELVKHIITDEGLNLGSLPKGLIPFHIYPNHITNPFQEHLIQGVEIGDTASKFHFTINKEFEEQIKSRIAKLERRMAINFVCEFSEQDPSTNSIAFNNDLNPAMDERGSMITRPAGHGTLINNLNGINADLIFIRNIDNMQHEDKAGTSLRSRKVLAGALLQFQDDVFKILRCLDEGEAVDRKVKAFNEKFDMRIPESLYSDPDFAYRFFNRPLRVCGMVKNYGAPGGGPFWVNYHGNNVRQIIEKSQISYDSEQVKLMETATHFNPVELVCAVRDYQGNKFDLNEFVDDEQYFIVNKTQAGQAIQYIEQPGLWNGAMAHWLTQFVEIESECFSPVKTVMDLLSSAHQAD